MTALFDGDDDERAVLKDLADELSDVRRRGVMAIDRESTRQQPLELPLLDMEIRATQWSRENRPVALRNLLTSALMYVDDRDVRTALGTFYGLHYGESLSAGQRTEKGLAHLKVPASASSEHRQAQIRDARFAFARAIRKARRYGFKPPMGSERFDPSPAEPAPRNVDLLNELLALRSSEGITPQRVEQREVPALRALPGVRRELTRQVPAAIGEAAVRFLVCAVRDPWMIKYNAASLVVASLNLSDIPHIYEHRVLEWMEAYEVTDTAEFEAREAWAFERFVGHIDALDQSPCADSERDAKAHAQAERVFGLLLDLTEYGGNRVMAYAAALIENEFPDLQRRFGHGAVSDDATLATFKGMLLNLHEQLELWTHDYLRYVEPDVLIFTPLSVIALIDHLLREGSAEEAQREFDSLAEAYRDALPERERQRLLDRANVEKREQLAERDALRRSLGILAQMLAFNQAHEYWDAATELRWRDRPYTPRLPSIAVSRLEPKRILQREVYR